MKTKLLLITILSLSLISITFASNYGSVVITEVLSVYDGDTFICNIPNYPPIIGHNMPIRIRGIYCLDINDKDINVKYMGIKAKEFTKNKLLNAKVIKGGFNSQVQLSQILFCYPVNFFRS